MFCICFDMLIPSVSLSWLLLWAHMGPMVPGPQVAGQAGRAGEARWHYGITPQGKTVNIKCWNVPAWVVVGPAIYVTVCVFFRRKVYWLLRSINFMRHVQWFASKTIAALKVFEESSCFTGCVCESENTTILFKEKASQSRTQPWASAI